MEVTGFDTWVLSLAVFLPLVGALVIMLIPKAYETELKLVALGSSLMALVSLLLLLRRPAHHIALERCR